MAVYKQTKIEFKAYNKAEEMPVGSNTNSILFINKGTSIAYVNGLPLASGESWGDSRNAGEVITGKFVINFELGATTTTSLLHVQLTRYI